MKIRPAVAPPTAEDTGPAQPPADPPTDEQPSDERPSDGRRRWRPNPEWTLAILGSLLLAVVLTWPTMRHPATTIPGDLGDPT